MEDFASTRLGRSEWLEAGLDTVRERGPAAVRLTSLSAKIGVTTGSFYWHFKGMSEFKRAMLALWETEYVDKTIAEMTQLNASPKKKLNTIAMRALQRDSAKLNHAVKVWSMSDGSALKVFDRVNNKRQEFVLKLFNDAGFEQEEAEVRARLFINFVLNTSSGDFVEGEQWPVVMKAVEIIIR